jgi:predicted  nucleic acid-binding Zn-ribbon protein
MEEDRYRGPESGEPVRSRPAGSDDPIDRLARTRAQIEELAAGDPARGLEAIDEIHQAEERIWTLESMLARAREREEGLTAQTVRDRATIASCEVRIAELSTIAAAFPESEAARRGAEVGLAEAERRLGSAQAEAQARRDEIERLRSRCLELETEIGEYAEEVASSAVARAEVAKAERERDEARSRAYTERRLAAEDRRRAGEANLRATELEYQLRAAERRLAHLANRPGEREVSEESSVEVPTAAPTPEGSPDATSVGAAPPNPDLPPQEPPASKEILDLTDQPPSSVDPDVSDIARLCFPLLDHIERLRWDRHRSGREPFAEREEATLIANNVESLLRICSGDPDRVTQVITAWAELRRERLEWEGDEDRSRHVVTVWQALGVKGVGNLFGSIPSDDPTYDPDLAAAGRARGMRA